MVDVVDLRTGERVAVFDGASAREATIAAYAQLKKKDFNTWNYAEKYKHKVVSGRQTVACGHFCAISGV